MAYQKQNNKTNAEWDAIRFKNSLDPRLGGYLHDASKLVSAGFEPTKQNIEYVKKWVDAIWDLAEKKKDDLLRIDPISKEDAEKANNTFAQKMNAGQQLDEEIQDGEINEANQDLKMEADELDEDTENDRIKEPF